jgi:hypothetical protein
VVCDAYSVTAKAATSSVAISESIDAAKITKNMYFITAGFKMCDADAVEPVSKQSLCVEGLYSNVQSRNNIFPTQIMMAKEIKETYEAFKSFFDFFLPWPVIKLSAEMECHISGKLLTVFKKST